MTEKTIMTALHEGSEEAITACITQYLPLAHTVVSARTATICNKEEHRGLRFRSLSCAMAPAKDFRSRKLFRSTRPMFLTRPTRLPQKKSFYARKNGRLCLQRLMPSEIPTARS